MDPRQQISSLPWKVTRDARNTFSGSEVLLVAHDGELDVVQIIAISAL